MVVVSKLARVTTFLSVVRSLVNKIQQNWWNGHFLIMFHYIAKERECSLPWLGNSSASYILADWIEILQVALKKWAAVCELLKEWPTWQVTVNDLWNLKVITEKLGRKWKQQTYNYTHVSSGNFYTLGSGSPSGHDSEGTLPQQHLVGASETLK